MRTLIALLALLAAARSEAQCVNENPPCQQNANVFGSPDQCTLGGKNLINLTYDNDSGRGCVADTSCPQASSPFVQMTDRDGSAAKAPTLCYNGTANDLPADTITGAPIRHLLTSSSGPDARFDVRDFGAKCDGTGDDAPAINAARAAAALVGGTTVLPPNSTCQVASSVFYEAYSTIVGAGNTSSVLTTPTSGTGFPVMQIKDPRHCTGGIGNDTTCDDLIGGGTRGPGCVCYTGADCQSGTCAGNSTAYYVHLRDFGITVRTNNSVGLDVSGIKDSKGENLRIWEDPGVTGGIGVLASTGDGAFGSYGFTLEKSFVGNFRGITKCYGGTMAGQGPCTVDADCIGDGSKMCRGGSNDGGTCTADSDCPGSGSHCFAPQCLAETPDVCVRIMPQFNTFHMHDGELYNHCGIGVQVDPHVLGHAFYGYNLFDGSLAIQGFDTVGVYDRALRESYDHVYTESLASSKPSVCVSDETASHTGACSAAAGTVGRGDRCVCIQNTDCQSGTCKTVHMWMGALPGLGKTVNGSWAAQLTHNNPSIGVSVTGQPILDNGLDTQITERKGTSGPATLNTLGGAAMQDSQFPICDDADPTKCFKFMAGTVATGTTRTLTVQDKTATLATTSDVIPTATGGTGLTSATDDAVLTGNGTVWQAKVVPDCDDTIGQHLNYDTATNTWSCGISATTPGQFTCPAHIPVVAPLGLGAVTSGGAVAPKATPGTVGCTLQVMPCTMAVTAIGIQLQTGVVGAECSLGVYDSAGGTKLIDTGPMPCATPGPIKASVPTTTMNAGAAYYTCLATDQDNSTMRFFGQGGSASVSATQNTLLTASGAQNAFAWTEPTPAEYNAQCTGAGTPYPCCSGSTTGTCTGLPATIGTPVPDTIVVPFIHLAAGATVTFTATPTRTPTATPTNTP